jgi:hypothetical protein
MMAPQYERARVLHEAIETSVQQLGEPIDRIKVTPQRVLIWAAGRRLVMNYRYLNSYDASGAAMLGGGRWIVECAEPTQLTAIVSWPIRLLGLLNKVKNRLHW